MEGIEKKKRFIVIVGMILVAVLASLIFEQMSTTYLVLVDGKTRVRIPRLIVLQKDCAAYKEWFESRFTPLSASTDRCPWTKPPKGNIGEFIINGEVFHIPRDYLIFDKNIPDGETVSGVLLMAVYPDMRPATWKKEEFDDQITISIDPVRGWEGCVDRKPCIYCKFKDYCTPSQLKYEYWSGMSDLNLKDLETYFIEEEHLPGLNLKRYKAGSRLTKYYVRGDPLKPSYWLMCIGSCESHFDFNSKIRIEYRFDENKHLQNHDEVKERVLEKLKKWQQ